MRALIHDGHPFTHRQRLDAGLTERGLRDAVRDGALRRMLDRVYVDALVPDTRELRVEAVRLVAPEHGVLADEWAAWLFGVDAFSITERQRMVPVVLVPHGTSRSRVPGVRCRQAIVDPSDLVDVGGVMVTRPVRTASDLLRKRWRPYALSAGDSMVRAGLVTGEEIWEHLATLKGYRGIRQARSLAAILDPRAESPGESWTRLRMIDAGFPRPESQIVVIDADGVERRLDLGYPDRLVAVEYDGRADHSSLADRDHDLYRREMLVAVGYRIVVVRREDVFGADTSFERTLGAMLGIEPLRRRWGGTELEVAA